MSLLFLTSITIMMMTWMSLLTNNPMNLSLMILMIALSTCLMLSLTMSSWYAMILFMIYIGGMMIMFSYFISLSSNDAMIMKTKLYFITFPLIIIKGNNLQLITPSFDNSKIMSLYTTSNSFSVLFIAMTLLMMMIIVVKMVKTKNAPLRSFHQYM